MNRQHPLQETARFVRGSPFHQETGSALHQNAVSFIRRHCPSVFFIRRHSPSVSFIRRHSPSVFFIRRHSPSVSFIRRHSPSVFFIKMPSPSGSLLLFSLSKGSPLHVVYFIKKSSSSTGSPFHQEAVPFMRRQSVLLRQSP